MDESPVESTIAVTLECHGELQALCGVIEQPVQLAPGANTVGDAIAALAEKYPNARDALARCAYAIGDSLVLRDRAVQDGDRIALIPPVSGG